MGNLRKTMPGYMKDFVKSWTQFFDLAGAKAKDIHIADMVSYNGSNNFDTPVVGGALSYDYLTENTKKVVQDIQTQYINTISDKEEMIKRSRELYETSIGQAIVDVFINDAFGAFRNPKDFKVEYEPDQDDLERLGEDFVEQVQKRINDTMDRLDYKAIVADLTPELLRDGEYALRLHIEKKKGITALEDDIDIIHMLPYYKGSKLVFVVEKSDKGSSFANQETLNIYKPENIAFFRLNYFGKQKVEFGDSAIKKSSFSSFKRETGLEIPKYVRICRPIYYNSMDAMEKVKLMEDIALANDFVNLTRPQIIGLGVPAISTSEDTKKSLREYEKHVSTVKNYLTSMQGMDLDAMVDACKQIKLLPLYGDGKGSLTRLDVTDNTKSTEIREAIRNQRANIATDNGIPPFYLNASEGGVDKTTMLKMYSRYTKKLSSVQQSIIETTVDIFHRDLVSVGLNIDPRNISVKLKNLVNGDILDELDMMVASVTGLGEMFENALKLAESPSLKLTIDNDKAKEAWDTYTSAFMNISGLLKIDDSPEDPVSDNDEFDDVDRTSFSGDSRRRPEPMELPGENEPPTPETEPDTTSVDRANDAAYNDFVNSSTSEVPQ